MPPSTPSVGMIVMASALEAVAATVLLKEHLPANPLLYVFIRALGVQLLLVGFYGIIIYPAFLSPLRHLPRAPGELPLLGQGLRQFRRPTGSMLLEWMKTVPNEGLIHIRGIGYRDRLLVTDPKVLGEILVTKTYDFEKPAPLRNFLRTVLGDGLIIVEGDEHKFLRKNLMPVFSFRHIKDLYSIFWDKSVQLTQGIAQQISESAPQGNAAGDGKAPTATVEVNHWANQVTMDIIGMAAMGRDFQALRNGHDPLITNYEELLEPTTEKQIFFAFNVFLPKWFVKSLPWKLNERHRVITGNLTKICLQLVRDKKQQIKTEPETHKDILSLLLRSNNFADEQLVDQLLTFLAAGHETTSSAFTWVTYLLAVHPEIQAALREEIRTHVPSPLQPVPADVDIAAILESLPLLNGVCNETLRIYPTVPVTVRIPVRDTSLLGTRVTPGTQILLSPWAINRNPKLWGDDAESFVPDRWIDVDPTTGERRPNNSGGAASNYSILTFLHGPRSCIGQGFAKAELRALVAAFAGSFDMVMADPNEKVMPHGVVTTKPENGMHLNLTHLGGW